MQTTEAQEDRIDAQEGEVRDPSAPYDKQPDDGQQGTREPVVPASSESAHPSAHAGPKVDEIEEAPDELQAAVGRNPFLRKRDRQVPRASTNLALRYPHPCGPPVW